MWIITCTLDICTHVKMSHVNADSMFFTVGVQGYKYDYHSFQCTDLSHLQKMQGTKYSYNGPGGERKTKGTLLPNKTNIIQNYRGKWVGRLSFLLAMVVNRVKYCNTSCTGRSFLLITCTWLFYPLWKQKFSILCLNRKRVRSIGNGYFIKHCKYIIYFELNCYQTTFTKTQISWVNA